MLLRKCLILLTLVSFSTFPMMGCTPSAEESGNTNDSTNDEGMDNDTNTD